jgi:hypothetical protein
MYPDYPWQDHFQKIGNAMNAPDLPELVRPELLQRFAMDLQRMQQSQAMPPPKQVTPMFVAQAGSTQLPTQAKPSAELPNAGQMMSRMLGSMQQQAPQANPAGVPSA